MELDSQFIFAVFQGSSIGCVDNEPRNESRLRFDGQSYRDQIGFVTDRPGHDRRYAIDARKIGREMGWRPEESFESGIRKTIQWYLTDGDWVKDVTSRAYRDWIEMQREMTP